MSIGSRLKEARLSKKLTQMDLASAVGVTKGAIGNYETDVSSPKEDILIRLMKYLDIDANFLYQDYISDDDCYYGSVSETRSDSLFLSPEERQIIVSYRSADDGIQTSVRKLLDIPDDLKNTKSSAI